MKILFPKNIEKWLISGLNFSFWPFTVSLVQLIILTIGAAGTLALMNNFMKWGMGKMQALVFSSPIVLIFAFVAFFRISEMNLLQFILKMLRTYFFDVPEKFQVDFPKVDPVQVALQKYQKKEKVDKIEYKQEVIRKDLLDKLQKEGLI